MATACGRRSSTTCHRDSRRFPIGKASRISPSSDAACTPSCRAAAAARFGHITPTALAARGRHLFIGNLFEFPIVDGASKVLRVNTITGRVTTFATGFTAIIGLTFDHRGRLYVLEAGNGQGSGFPDPGAGRIVRVDPWGRRAIIAEALTFPTGVTLGGDGRLYVSNRGLDTSPVGTGETLAVDVGE